MLTNDFSERNLKALGQIAEPNKNSFLNQQNNIVNSSRESPKMFLMSSQELDLRKSEIFNENRNSSSRISTTNHNIKHKSTKSEAIQHHLNPSSTKSGSISNYSSLNRGNQKNIHVVSIQQEMINKQNNSQIQKNN